MPVSVAFLRLALGRRTLTNSTYHMMFKPQKAITLLALAGLAFASTAANAATTSFAIDDLILGIRQDSTSALQSQAPNVLLVDLGQATNFTSNISSINMGSGFATEMSSLFGSSWATDPSVHWGIVGTSGVAGLASGIDQDPNVLYATSTSSSPYLVQSDTAQGTVRGTITTMDNTFKNKTLNVANVTNGITQGLTTSGGWGVNNTSTGNNGTSFGYFSNMEANFSNGTPSSMNLYRMDDATTSIGSPGSTVGSFAFNSAGNLSFTAAVSAAPEPARVAFLGLGLGALFLRRRRR